MEIKTPFVINKISDENYLESNDGKICCRYEIIPHYYVAVVESKDRSWVKEHCAVFNCLKEIKEYLEQFSKQD